MTTFAATTAEARPGVAQVAQRRAEPDPRVAVASARDAARSVPLRALTMSLIAMGGAAAAAIYWPSSLLEHQLLACGLALIPALLLAHYRGWRKVTLLLAAGLVGVSLAQPLAASLNRSIEGTLLVPLALAPYIAIALGAGWFDEVRRYQQQLRLTQLQLIQSEKLDSMGRIAAGVAHEVKNPLMILLTGVKILSKRVDSADESTKLLLADMVDAITRADRIIGGLLSYAREGALELRRADLNDVVRRSLLLVKHEIESRRTRVETDFDSSLPGVMLDEFKIQQVLVNVITNALHALDRDGEIRITTSVASRRRGDTAVIRVADSGPGIPPEHLRKIFDPFFTTKPAGSGTGLGLSVARQIVELHGGTIEIGNHAGGGAEVTITFQIAETEHAHGTTDTAGR
jgi:C4-dicarboxylate-specific signal transduction histidine kinase